MKCRGGFDGSKMSFPTGSRRSQPPLALSVPLSRFTSRVGGGSAFFVRCQMLTTEQTWRGGARIGLMNATWPFAQLKVTPAQLVLRVVFLGTYIFKPEQVT